MRTGIDVFEVAAAEIRAFYSPRRWPRVLEIGCGAGEVFGHVGFATEAYLGVDISESMLDQFHIRHPSVRTRCADAVSFVYDDAAFDFILVNNVLQYLNRGELVAVVRNVARMLAPRGRAFLGNVPDRALRRAFAHRALAGSRRPAPVRAASYAVELLSAQFLPGRPTFRLGYWHARSDVVSAANGAGLSTEFFGCLLHWYRFSAVLTPQTLIADSTAPLERRP